MVKTSGSTQEVVQSSRQTACSTKYTGVRKRNWGKWVSEIRLPNSRERIWLGSYDDPIKAARAFDAAQFCLRGSKANLNFPDNPPDIPGGQSMTPSEIQAVATRFANLAGTEQTGDKYQQTSFKSPVSAARSTDLAAATTSDVFEIQVFDTSCNIVESDTLTDSTISYSPCFSDVTVQMDNNEVVGVVEESFYEQLSLSETLGSGNYVSEFGYFAGFDEYNYTTLLQPENYDYNVEDTYDASIYQDSYLWNF